MGSTLPFARTRSERERTRDPRSWIEERYASRDAYLAQVREAAKELIGRRYPLPEDLEAIVVRAEQLWDYVQGSKPAPGKGQP